MPVEMQIRDRGKNIAGAEFIGPEAHLPGNFFTCEDAHHPRMIELRRKYGLDRVARAGGRDFRDILKVRRWVFTRWPVNNNSPFPYDDALAILKEAKKGVGFYCAHSAMVAHAVYSALGWVSRIIYIDVDHRAYGRSRHHAVTEVFSTQFVKWVVVDPKYDVHFEKGGVPLSAMDMYRAARSGNWRGIVKMRGPARRKFSLRDKRCDGFNGTNFFWVSYLFRPDMFTHVHWPMDNDAAWLAVLDDKWFRRTRWHRSGGKGKTVEHHSYRTDAFVRIKAPDRINWTPGVTRISARQTAPMELKIELRSATPNFAGYRYRLGRGPWKRSADGNVSFRLRPGRNSVEAAVLNVLGVEGPRARAVVKVKP
jgi:hypothetical protein